MSTSFSGIFLHIMGTPELTLNQETENTTQNTRRLSPIEAPGGAETAAAGG